MGLAVLGVLILAAGCAWGGVEITPPGELSVMRVARTRVPIVPDGEVSAAEWGGAEVGRLSMDVFHPERPVRQGTVVRALRDDRYLYVAFECEDTDVWGTMMERDAPVYVEEAVEIFIDPEGRYRNYYEIDAGPAGGTTDLLLVSNRLLGGPKNVAYDVSGLRVGVRVNGTVGYRSDRDAGWSAEFAIPWSEFRHRSVNVPPQPGDRWRVNFYRIDRPTAGEDEYTAWSRSVGAFHEPRNFGVLEFR